MTRAARYVGPVAVALGVGVAVATALADSASAAPQNSTPAAPGRPGAVDRADGSAHGDRGPRAASPNRARDSGRSTSARPPTPDRAPPKSAAATRPVITGVARPDGPDAAVRVSLAPAPSRTAGRPPIRAATVRREPIRQASAVTSPATASPRLFGDPRGRRITIYQGTHFVIPNRWALWVTKDSGDATFIADSAYDLKDEDQYDWNKLAGITFTPWRPDRNSSMVVWRYNLQNGTFEVGPFFNVDFRYVFPTKDEIITVPVDQTFSYVVDYDGISVSYGDRTVHKATPQDLTPNFWTSARVTGWFGGNEVAPRTISYFQHR